MTTHDNFKNSQEFDWNRAINGGALATRNDGHLGKITTIFLIFVFSFCASVRACVYLVTEKWLCLCVLPADILTFTFIGRLH